MITKGDLNQQAIQRELLRKSGFAYKTEDVYCIIHAISVKPFLTIMFAHKIEGWWLYNEELIAHGFCTVEEYREQLRQEVMK